LPKPILWDDHHGTRCAGEIAAVKNDACGVGIAYESKVAGIRILSGPISDVDEAAALNYGFQNTSIYSCSWGPPDDGRSMAGPSLLIQKAVLNGINKGRDGKGSVFVFAAGNGAASGDQCNFDGYTNSIYSVTVAAVDYKGLHPYYSEACAANMITTYSSGSGEHVHTTDVGKNKCSSSHGGTSAAAPQAVGVFALALSVRPDLTWRDVQHLCVKTAGMINSEDPDWEMTSVNKKYSYKYGWGVLDAYSYVQAARDWKLVNPQAWAFTPVIELTGAQMNATSGEMSGGEPITATGVTSKQIITKDFLQENNFERIEHIDIKVWITHAKRGDVEVELTSPTGVKSILAGKRTNDVDKKGFPGWRFMTVKHW
jgi:kexin